MGRSIQPSSEGQALFGHIEVDMTGCFTWYRVSVAVSQGRVFPLLKLVGSELSPRLVQQRSLWHCYNAAEFHRTSNDDIFINRPVYALGLLEFV